MSSAKDDPGMITPAICTYPHLYIYVERMIRKKRRVMKKKKSHSNKITICKKAREVFNPGLFFIIAYITIQTIQNDFPT